MRPDEVEDVFGFVLSALRSGLRRGTLSHLEWDHVDFARGDWAIPGSLMKSRREFRGRPIDPELLEWLREHRRPSGVVFGSLDSKLWERACKLAGLEWLRVHDLRRSFVTRCRRRGLALEVCMFMSDHSDIRTVVEHYRAIDESDVASAARALFERKPQKEEEHGA